MYFKRYSWPIVQNKLVIFKNLTLMFLWNFVFAIQAFASAIVSGTHLKPSLIFAACEPYKRMSSKDAPLGDTPALLTNM